MSGTDALYARIERLEAEGDIRRLVACYFRICDDLGPHSDLEALGQLFTRDAVWQGKGRYDGAFGGYRGRRAIVEMIASYCLPSAHFAMTGHFFSSEAIEMDGDTARGRWMMLQCSTYAQGASDLRSAALTLGFAREEGYWRIADFATHNLFSRRVDRWSDADPIPVPPLQGTTS